MTNATRLVWAAGVALGLSGVVRYWMRDRYAAWTSLIYAALCLVALYRSENDSAGERAKKRINFWPYVYGVIAAVLAVVLLNWFKKGWNYVLDSWWQYPLVAFVAILAVAFALALKLTARKGVDL